MRILNVVADDENAATTERLAEIWRRAGHVVSNVTSTQSAILKASASNQDIVVVDSPHGAPAAAARRALVGGPVPYLIHARGALTSRRTDSKVANSAAAVLFATEDEALRSLGAFRPWLVTARIVGFGSDEPPPGELRQRGTFLAAHPTLMNRRALLFHGALGDGCDTLIDALARNAAAHPNVDLVFAGPDDPPRRAEIANRANALGLTDRVHWAGEIADDMKWGAYRQAEALILPSHFDGAEAIVAEALACSLPALITDRTHLWREIERCGAGLVAPDALLDRYLAMSHTQQRTMHLAARTCFERHFRYETVAARMIGAFREAMLRSRPA